MAKVGLYFTAGVIIFTSIVIGTSVLFPAINMAFKFGLGFTDLIVIILYQIPRFLTYSVGLSSLVSSVLITHNMSRSGEIMALKAVGIGPLALLKPFIGAGICVAVFVAGINETLVPYCETQLAAFNRYLLTTKQPNIQPQVIYTDYNATTQTQRLIYAVSVADDMHLSDVMILDYAATGNLNSITNAAQGTWLAGKGWRFYDGVVYQFESASLRRIEYKRQAINLVQPEATQPQNRPIYSLSSQDLYQRLKTQPDNKQDYVEFHLKLALPITCLLFSILGALTGIQINRKTAANPLGNAVMLLVLYYSLISVGMSVAIAGLLPPIFAGWGPTGAIGVCVVILFYRQYRL